MKLFRFLAVLWACAVAVAQSTQVQLNVATKAALAAVTVQTWQTNLTALVVDDGTFWQFAPGNTGATNALDTLASAGVAGRWRLRMIPPYNVPTVSDLASLGTNGPTSVVVLGTQGGTFERVAAATYTASAVAYNGVGCQWVNSDWRATGKINPRWWGVAIDGVTDDTLAWRDLATWVNSQHGNTIIDCPPGVSLVRSLVEGVRDDEYCIRFLGTVTNLTILGHDAFTFYCPDLSPTTDTNWVTISSATLSGADWVFTAPGHPFAIGQYLVGYGFSPLGWNNRGTLPITAADATTFTITANTACALVNPTVVGKMRRIDQNRSILEFFYGARNLNVDGVTFRGCMTNSAWRPVMRSLGVAGIKFRYQPSYNVNLRVRGEGLYKMLNHRNIDDTEGNMLFHGANIDVAGENVGYGFDIVHSENLRINASMDGCRRGGFLAGCTNATVNIGVRNFDESGFTLSGAYDGDSQNLSGCSGINIRVTDTGTVGPVGDGSMGATSTGDMDVISASRVLFTFAGYTATNTYKMSGITAELSARSEDMDPWSTYTSVGSCMELFYLTGYNGMVVDGVKVSGVLDRTKIVRGNNAYASIWYNVPWGIEGNNAYFRKLDLSGLVVHNPTNCFPIRASSGGTWTNGAGVAKSPRAGMTVVGITSGAKAVMDKWNSPYYLMRYGATPFSSSERLRISDCDGESIETDAAITIALEVTSGQGILASTVSINNRSDDSEIILPRVEEWPHQYNAQSITVADHPKPKGVLVGGTGFYPGLLSVDTMANATTNVPAFGVSLLATDDSTRMGALYKSGWTGSRTFATNSGWAASGGTGAAFSTTGNVLRAYNANSGTLGLLCTNSTTNFVTYLLSFRAKGNEADTLAISPSRCTNVTWMSPTALGTDWADYQVQITAGSEKVTGAGTNSLLIYRASVNSSSDYLLLTNVVLTSRFPVDNERSFVSGRNTDRVWSQVQLAPVTVSRAITGVGSWIVPTADVVVLSPDGGYTLTSLPTITAGYKIGQKLSLLNNSANAVVLQDNATLPGSGLLLADRVRSVVTNTVVNLVWDGAYWCEPKVVPSVPTSLIVGVSGYVSVAAGTSAILVNPNGNYVLTSAPQIADGYTGQVITLFMDAAEANTVTFTDEGTHANSNLWVGGTGTNVVLSAKNPIQFIFSGDSWNLLTRP